LDIIPFDETASTTCTASDIVYSMNVIPIASFITF